MATDPTTPPQPPQVPQWMVTVLTLMAGTVKNPFFHTLLTALLAAMGTVFYAKQALPNALPDLVRPLVPKILQKPKKAEDAIGKIRFGNSGCTATVIGPISTTDAYLDILTAAHCVKLGAVGTMQLKDGRTLAVTCLARDPEADAAWLRAKNPGGDVPYLLLADATPDNGEAVWHQGYGIDRPGNRESGVFKGIAHKGLQCQFRLSVSPGDSGGGIILDSASKVVSPVCCTTRLAAMGDVWGASPQAAAKIRPKKSADEIEPPLIYPILPLDEEVIGVMPLPLPEIRAANAALGK